MKLISFDLQSNFGFFRKPETNNTLNVSYNIIHRPALLGLLGAIIGLQGYQKKGELPEYYQKLHKLKIGIAPLDHDNGNFAKTPIKYSNTVGYANKGTNFLTEELTLISPKYRIYLLLDESISEHQQLLQNIQTGNSEFIPYFGKNEFTAWWDKNSIHEYEYTIPKIDSSSKIKIVTLFLKDCVLKESASKPELSIMEALTDDNELPFMYFERLPIDFEINMMQYDQQEMVYTTYHIENCENMPGLCYLTDYDSYVQLL
jgi:CRISPR-associated protein Cas5h